jgi:hypothetical protein
MATYYCDLADGTFADRTGADVANEYTNPAGFQAAIRGTGNATALAAGDTIYLQGTGDLSRLIEIDCNGTDISNWGIGDTVRNDNLGGGAAGDDWTGVVVEPAVGASDIVLIWLDVNLDEADVDIADGIENTVAGGGAGDPTNVGAMTSVDTPGIEFDTAEGSRATGEIKIWGTTDLTDPTNNYGEAILDGTDHASTKRANHGITFLAGAEDFLYFRYVTFQNTLGDGWRMLGLHLGYDTFWKCKGNGNTGNGWNGNSSGFDFSKWIQCQANDNTGRGFYRTEASGRYIFCEAKNNGAEGWELIDTGAVLVGCVAHNNTIGIELFSDTGLVVHCVADGNSTNGIDFSSVTVDGGIVIGSRITNQSGAGDFGINSAQSANFVWENWNAFYNNNTDRNNVDTGEDSSSAGADDGYTDQANDDFNVQDGKTLDSTAVTVP